MKKAPVIYVTKAECTDLLIFNQIILVITVVLMYNKRNGGDSYGKTKKVQYPSYGK